MNKTKTITLTKKNNWIYQEFKNLKSKRVNKKKQKNNKKVNEKKLKDKKVNKQETFMVIIRMRNL